MGGESDTETEFRVGTAGRSARIVEGALLGTVDARYPPDRYLDGYSGVTFTRLLIVAAVVIAGVDYFRVDM
jgi:hypothetical protein